MWRDHLLWPAVLAAIVGCGGASGATAPTMQVTSAPAPGLQSDPNIGYGCPMALPGTTASVSDTENGVAVSFTGPASALAALRSRVHWLADQHAFGVQHMMGMHGTTTQGCPCMSGGGCGTMHGQGMMHGPAVASDAAVTEIPDGARLALTARNPAEVAALRNDVRARVAQMQSGQCPML